VRGGNVTKWEEFEEYLFERDLLGEDFNCAAVAEDWGISTIEASSYIQCYLNAQTRSKSKTLFVLRREPDTRTKTAMWHVGERAFDARGVGGQLASDMKRRISRYTEPTLVRIAEKNPRALTAAKAVGKGIEAAVELLGAMLDD
jgi:hypothetical protein